MAASPAKISPPRLSGAYLRHRLFKQLDRSRRRPIVWLTGPPGSGKTTLVASYLAARRLPHLWYQTDSGDGDPANFFYYLGLAAAKASPRRRPPLPLLTPEYRYGLPAFTLRFFERLFERLRQPFVMVFDNYHEVPADSGLHEVVSGGLSSIPEGRRAILISREAPPASMARLRANQAMEMIEWEDLRLTEKELKGLVRVLREERFSEQAIRALHAESEGWAAGVVLMLEHFKPERLESLSPGRSVREAIFDYFAGEILGKTDARTQNFLLQTSLLPRMTARVTERLTGLSDAGAILSDMNRRNYFTTRHADAEPMYQYHDLFRDFLQTRARQLLGTAQLAEVQHRAASALEESGQVESAVDLYCRAGDWSGAIRLILNSAGSMVVEGRGRTLEDWIERLPREIVEQTPWLLYWSGVSRLPFDPPQSRRCFEQAFMGFERSGVDLAGLFLAWCGVVDTFVFEWGNFTPLDRWIAAMEDLLARHPELPSPEIEARVASGMLCALMYRQPHHPELPAWEEKVKTLVLSNVDIRLRMMIGIHLIFYYTWWRGDLAKAGLLVKSLQSAASSAGIPPLPWIAWHAIKAAYDWMTASREHGIRAVEEGLQAAETTGVHLWDFMLLAQGVHGASTFGEPDKTAAFLRRMESLIHLNQTRRLDVSHYHYLSASDALNSGDLPRALEHAETALAIAVEAGTPFAEGIGCIAVAEVLLELGDEKKAAVYLDRARRIGRAMKSHVIEYLSFLPEADFCLNRQGGEKKGLAALSQFLAVGKAQGFVNIVTWRPEKLARICVRALEAGIEVEYVQELVRRRNLIPKEPPLDCAQWPWALKISTLGRFALVKDGKPVRFAGKAQKKPLDLLKALIAHGGREVSEEQLSDALWPEAEGDAARRAFDTTLHRLRKLLGHEQALVLESGRLSLNPRYCCVDVWAWERLLDKLEVKLREEPTQALMEEVARLAERALGLYRGPFLSEEVQAWVFSEQERLRSRFLRHLGSLGQYWEGTGRWEKAVECYGKGLEVDPLAEGLYQRLMAAYVRLGRRAEALAAYQRCRKTLLSTFGVEPSPETQAIFRNIHASSR